MTTSASLDSDAHQPSWEIARCEERRIEALLNADAYSLRQVLSADLIHIHSSGREETLTEYLAGLTVLNFVSIKRGELHTRFYGSTAVATGELSQVFTTEESIEPRQSDLLVTQIWVKNGRDWKLTSFHACRKTT